MNRKDLIEQVLTRGVSEVVKKQSLEQKLNSKTKLRIKLGIDPTSPNIHIGRAVVLWKLRQFQELGHQVVFIVGDFTGLIGDTSDKEAERPMLSESEVALNMKSYLSQAFKILDKDKTETHRNSTWLKKLGFLEIGKMADAFGLHDFSSREIIKRRLDAGKRVSVRELLYPIMQGYDSVKVSADVELGGTDQTYNLLAGRVIQPLYGQKPQDIVMTQILEGTDGRKMSSSWGNSINLNDSPNDMFGKVMSIKDELMKNYFLLATQIPKEEIETIFNSHSNPRDIKLILAEHITAMYNGKEAAIVSKNAFIKQFTEKFNPDDIKTVKLPEGSYNMLDLLVKLELSPSKSDARRLVDQNGVKVNGSVVKNIEITIKKTNDLVVQVGKRKFIKIK